MYTRRISRLADITRFALVMIFATIGLTTNAIAQAAPLSTGALPEFTILIFESDAQLATRSAASKSDKYWDTYDLFAATLAKAGVLRGGSALDERERSTVRGSGSADGAVRNAKLGGYFVIAAKDMATAEAWARMAPPEAIAVEVRPHRSNPHMSAAMKP